MCVRAQGENHKGSFNACVSVNVCIRVFFLRHCDCKSLSLTLIVSMFVSATVHV